MSGIHILRCGHTHTTTTHIRARTWLAQVPLNGSSAQPHVGAPIQDRAVGPTDPALISVNGELASAMHPTAAKSLPDLNEPRLRLLLSRFLLSLRSSSAVPSSLGGRLFGSPRFFGCFSLGCSLVPFCLFLFQSAPFGSFFYLDITPDLGHVALHHRFDNCEYMA